MKGNEFSIKWITLYYSIIIPYLTYCPFIWDPHKSSPNLPIIEKNQFFSLNCFVTNGTAIILPFHFTISHPFQPLNYPDSWLTYLLYKITNNLLYFPSDVFFLDPFVLMLLTFMSLNITLQAI